MSQIKQLFHIMLGFRKFMMGLIGLSIIVVTSIVMLILFLNELITGDRFVDFVTEIGKVVGIIVSAFMATNIGEHIVNAVKERIKK